MAARATRLPDLPSGYAAADAFNAAETGLYYRALPSRSMVVRSDPREGIKTAKERVTVLLTCSAAGEERVTVLLTCSAAGEERVTVLLTCSAAGEERVTVLLTCSAAGEERVTVLLTCSAAGEERVTVLLTCSAAGEKLMPLLIGKSAKPRCFKGLELATLPVTYRANKKAWMTSVLFKELTPPYLPYLILHKYKTTLYLTTNTKSFKNYRHTHVPQ